MLAVSPSMTGLAIPVRQPGAAAALKCATPHDVCCWLVSTALQAAPLSVESCAWDGSNACVCGHCTPPASPQSDRAPRMRACCIQTRTAQEIVRASRLNARWCAHATPSSCAMQGSPCLRSPASQPRPWRLSELHSTARRKWRPSWFVLCKLHSISRYVGSSCRLPHALTGRQPSSAASGPLQVTAALPCARPGAAAQCPPKVRSAAAPIAHNHRILPPHDRRGPHYLACLPCPTSP